MILISKCEQMNIASSRQLPSPQRHRLTLISRDERRETYRPYTVWSQFRNTNNAFCPVPDVWATCSSWEQLAGQSYQYFRAAPLCPWMFRVICMNVRCACPSGGNRIPTLNQRWNNVIVNEWGFCFSSKDLQAVSYFELRDPFIFWLFLLLTLISSADISAAHVIWWNFLNIFSLLSKLKIKQCKNREEPNKWKQRVSEG